MLKIEDMYLTDLEGTLMYKNTPLAYFKIKDRKLIEYRRLRETTDLLPYELSEFRGKPVTYAGINSFFRERVVLDGSQACREYLDALGLPRYDFNKIVQLMHGANNLDNWWVASEDYHPTWEKMQEKRNKSYRA